MWQTHFLLRWMCVIGKLFEHQKGDLVRMLLNNVMVIIVVYTKSYTSGNVSSWAKSAQW